ncbi:hypothetical protein ACHAWF_016292 [Thalassiosira exigua]
MSSSNRSNNDGDRARSGRRSGFDSVPADDGFRNYMSRKIELQRKQFGLVLPPPPPPSPPPEPEPKFAPAPPKILKRPRLRRRRAEDNDGVPTPRFTDVASSDGETTGSAENSARSVRFHHDVESEEKEVRTVSHVLANLKQKHSGGRRRSSLLRKRRRSGSEFDVNTPTEGNAHDRARFVRGEAVVPTNQCTSVLGVLDNLQKRHGGSASKSKRSPRHSQSSNDRSVEQSGMASGAIQKHPTPLSKAIEKEADSVAISFTDGCSKDAVENVDGLAFDGTESAFQGPVWQDQSVPHRFNESHHTLDKISTPQSHDEIIPDLSRPSLATESPSTDDPQTGIPCKSDEKLQYDRSKTPFDSNKSSTIQIAEGNVEELPHSARKAKHRPDLFFAGIVVLVNGHTSPDTTTLMRLLHKHGGDLEKYETHRVTHIIAEQLSAAKANIYKRQKKPTPVCRPEWITDSVERGVLLPYGDYLLADVKNADAAGTRSVKTFFTSEAATKESRDSNSILHEDAETEAEGKGCSREEASSHRWQDTHPSKAKYTLNGQVRTVGNDPNFLESYFQNSRLSYIGSFKQRVKSTKTLVPRPRLKGAKKFVLLVDMDCFFASVALRKYPEYREKPVAVGHAHIARSNAPTITNKAQSKNSSSELSTCNYIARKYGIRKGMFLGDAIQLCPDLVVLPYDFDGFEEVAGIVADLLHGYAQEYNGCLEQVSCDESYMEVNIVPTDCPDDDAHAFVKNIAEHIRADIVKKTECTASIGIGPNKLLAKLAADRVKPNASFVVKAWREFLANLSLRDIPGIGRKLQKKLQIHGLVTVNDVWDLEDNAVNAIGEIIGKGNAHKIVQYCNGKDDRAVTPVMRKSIGAECNYGVRFDGPYSVEYMIQGLAKEVEARMTSAGVRGSKLTVKVMKSKDPSKVPGKFLGHGLCENFSKSADTLLTRDRDIIASAALKSYHGLAHTALIDDKSVRGMGIVMTCLKHDDEVDSLSSSPSKLSAWLKQDCPTPKLSDRNLSPSEENENADQAKATFSIEDHHDVEPTAANHSDSSCTMPTFSQLDQDVLTSLPEDILNEVKSHYGKSPRQEIDDRNQSSPNPSKRKSLPKYNKDVNPIPIAGQTSVRRMLKLACIKSGDDKLDESGFSLSQLECLPLEVQLQIANGDCIEIAKRQNHKPKKTNESYSITADQNCPKTETQAAQITELERGDSGSNFYRDNVAPIQSFIRSSPNPGLEEVERMENFLSVCVSEGRAADAVTFLRTMKNMNGGWDHTIYEQLRDSIIGRVSSTTDSMLDIKWLGL